MLILYLCVPSFITVSLGCSILNVMVIYIQILLALTLVSDLVLFVIVG